MWQRNTHTHTHYAKCWNEGEARCKANFLQDHVHATLHLAHMRARDARKKNSPHLEESTKTLKLTKILPRQFSFLFIKCAIRARGPHKMQFMYEFPCIVLVRRRRVAGNGITRYRLLCTMHDYARSRVKFWSTVPVCVCVAMTRTIRPWIFNFGPYSVTGKWVKAAGHLSSCCSSCIRSMKNGCRHRLFQ